MSEQKTCLGKTAAGNPCGRKPTTSGYCNAHDPARLARLKSMEGQKAQFHEVIESVLKTAKAKGWSAYSTNEDREGWKYATVVNAINLTQIVRCSFVSSMIQTLS